MCYKKMQQQFYYEGGNFDQIGSFFPKNKQFPFLPEGEEEEENENTHTKSIKSFS